MKERVNIKKILSILLYLSTLSTIFVNNSFSQLDRERQLKLQQINSEALTLVRMGKIEEAIETLLEGIKIWDRSPEINYNLGMLYFLLGNLDEAERYAIRATIHGVRKRQVILKGDYATGLRTSKGKVAESVTIEKWTLELAIKMGNDFLEAYDLLGNVYFKKGEFEKSVLAFKKVVEIDPSDALGYYNLGCSYFALKEYHKAEKSWQEAIKHDKRKREKGEDVVEESGQMPRVSVTVLKRTVFFHSYKSLGSLYQEKGELRKAIESYQEAIEIFPTDADCHYELGKLYIQTGEKENAIKNLQKYLEYGTEKEKEVRGLLKRLKE